MSTNKISKVQLNDQEYLLKGDAQNIKDVMAQTISDLYSRIDTGSDTTIISEILERLNSLEVDKATKDQIEELWRQINGMNQQIPNSVLNYYFAYKQSDEAPARPEDSEEYPPQGWKSYPETPDSDKIIYMTMARKLNGEYQRWADNHRWTQPIAYGDKTKQTLNIESNIALYRLSSGTPSLSEQERKTPSYPNGWSTTPDFLVQNNKEVYMITAKTINGKYIEVGGYYWSVPMRIGGGTTSTTGSDTTVYNYVYYPSTDGTPPSTPQFTVRQIEDNNEIDGWYDSPQGIQEDRKYEYISLSIGESLDRSNWSSPVLWSKWGERGMDGDGVEYVYTRNQDGSNPGLIFNISDSNYQDDDYIPTDSQGQPWHDQPQGVTEGLPYEFVAVRKQKDGVWQRFTGPSLWAKYGKDGGGSQGLSGAIIRYVGDWESLVADSGEFIFECNTPEGANVRYIDVVTLNENNNLVYYQCKARHTAYHNVTGHENSLSPAEDTTNWEQADQFKFIVTETLIANWIKATTVSAKEVIIEQEGEGNTQDIVAGMTSSEAKLSSLGDVRIWAGTEGQQPNVQEAPFIVNDKGTLYARDANIQGNVYATSGVFNGEILAQSLAVANGNKVIMQFKAVPQEGIYDENDNLLPIPPGVPALFVYWDDNVYVYNLTKLNASSGQTSKTTYRSNPIYKIPGSESFTKSQMMSQVHTIIGILETCHTDSENKKWYSKQLHPDKIINHWESPINLTTKCNYYIAESTDPSINGKVVTSIAPVNVDDETFTGYCISEDVFDDYSQDAGQPSGVETHRASYKLIKYENGIKTEEMWLTIGSWHIGTTGIDRSDFEDIPIQQAMYAPMITSTNTSMPTYSKIAEIQRAQAIIDSGVTPQPGIID